MIYSPSNLFSHRYIGVITRYIGVNKRNIGVTKRYIGVTKRYKSVTKRIYLRRGYLGLLLGFSQQNPFWLKLSGDIYCLNEIFGNMEFI